MGAANVMLYAKWTAKTFAITYESNGGTLAAGASMPSDSALFDSTYTVAAKPAGLARTGYDFVGWTTSQDGSGTVYAVGGTHPSFTVTGAVTLYAKWSPVAYTIAYHANGGTLPSDSAAFDSTYPVAAKPAGLARTGYDFIGWTTSQDGSGTVYSVGGANPSFTVTGNVTLYAKWTAKTFTITYASNGGTLAAGASMPSGSASFDSTYTVAAEPAGLSRTGYELAGWNTAADGSGQSYAAGSGSFTMGAANVTLYAKWVAKTFAITYSANDGTLASGSMPSGSAAFDSTYTVAAKPDGLERAGYDFAGWNTAADGSGQSYAAGSGSFRVTGDVTLHARWTPRTYSVTYHANGSTGGAVPSAGSAGYGTVFLVAGNTGQLVRTGHAFIGWTTSQDGTGTVYAYGGANPSFLMGAGNVDLYAAWSVESYTITYDRNGGVLAAGTSLPAPSITYGSSYPVIAQPSSLTRDGYTFNGWTVQPDGSGTTYSSGSGTSSFTVTGPVTLYAKWTANTYDITYHANAAGVTGAPAAGSYTMDGAVYSIAHKPDAMVRTDYRFEGWNTKADGSGAWIAEGSAYSTPANLELYAQWVAIQHYTITYDGNQKTGGTVPSTSTALAGSSVIASGNSGSLVRLGYEFAGWNTQADGLGMSVPTSGSITITGDVTLFAKWTARPTYTVTYSADATEGTAPQAQTFTTDVGATIAAGTGLARPGYKFLGWSATQAASSAEFSVGEHYDSAVSITLFPVWTALATHVVSYDANLGSGTVSSQNVTEGGSVHVADGTGFTRDGYTLEKWAVGSAGSTDFVSLASHYTPTGTITLYAVWKPVTYAITYDANGGEGTVIAGEFTTGGSAYVVAGVGSVSHAGHTFAGWSTSKSGTGGVSYAAGSSYSGLAPLRLFAQWTPVTYTLSFSANSGDGTVPTSLDYTVHAGATVPGGAGLSRAGYSFTGWNTAADGNGTTWHPGENFTTIPANSHSTATLFAVWVPVQYSVTYDANGGSGEVPHAQAFTVETYPAIALSGKGDLARAGYSFLGWNTSQAGGAATRRQPGQAYSSPASLQLFAEWSPQTYTITYHSNDGTGTIASQSFTVVTPVVLSSGAGFTRVGYTMTGWNTKADGSGTDLGKAAQYATPGDVTLYAVWDLTEYAITYHSNTPAGGIETRTFTVLTPATLIDNPFVHAGYAFASWNTKADGSGTSRAPGFSYDTPGSVSWYATWRRVSTDPPGTDGPGESSEPAPSTPPVASVPQIVSDERLPANLDLVTTPVVANATAGNPAVLVDGSSVPARIERTGHGARVDAAGWSLSLTGEDPPAGIDASTSPLVVTSGAGMETAGTGFLAGTEVVAYVVDPAIVLGRFEVRADGSFVTEVPVPRTLAPGRYLVQVNGFGPADASDTTTARAGRLGNPASRSVVRSVTLPLLVLAPARKVVRVSSEVRFASSSARLDAKAKRALAKLRRSIPAGATGVTVQVLGYVQPTPNRANNYTLSTARALAAARRLGNAGVDGQYFVSGRGRGSQPGAASRRAQVVIAFTLAR